jgi:hypothetical protein
LEVGGTPNIFWGKWLKGNWLSVGEEVFRLTGFWGLRWDARDRSSDVTVSTGNVKRRGWWG